MGAAEVALLLFGLFGLLIAMRVPVAFALGLACIPVFFIDPRLTALLLLNEMLKSYNSFILLAVPLFLLTANVMNYAGITDKLIELARTSVGHLPGLLIGLSLMGAVLVYAKRRGVYARATAAEFAGALLRAVVPLAMPAIIIGGIVGGFFTATEASVVAVLYALLLGLVVYRTLVAAQIPKILYESARFAAITLFCVGTASAFGWVLASRGAGVAGAG